MDVIALLLLAAAALALLIETIAERTNPPRVYGWLIPLGLFLLTVGLICQFTHVSGHNV